MSVIFITQHDESIYFVTQKERQKRTPSPRFESKFAGTIKHQVERQLNPNTKEHATMGLAEYVPPDPKDFLKKKSKKPLKVAKDHVCIRRELPPVPKLDDIKKEEQMEVRTKKCEKEKNFISVNVKRAMQLEPQDHLQTLSPWHYGRKHEFPKTYGRTPKYLRKIIRIRERDMQMKKDESGKFQPKCKYITRQEREGLLVGLKQNWQELQHQYQGLPILTDTIPKINRKSKMEAELRQLEKDIVLIERHPYIYVYKEDV